MRALSEQSETVFLPYRGEFGHKVMWHAPWVHAQRIPKIVCCEAGEEALFPSATRHVIVPSKPDGQRREWLAHDQLFVEQTAAQFGARTKTLAPLGGHPGRAERLQRFVPWPFCEYDIQCDIVVCPRRRAYGRRKNWPHWVSLVERLGARHQLFAAGAEDSSYPVPCPRAWDYERCLDATIAAFRRAALAIATDSGLAHLALLCGTPLLLLSHQNGRTAPGYGQIKWPRLIQGNHCLVPVRVAMDAWPADEPFWKSIESVVERVIPP